MSRFLNFNVKFWHLTVTAVFCILAVTGAGVGFTQPREVTAETVQARYEHTGRFDYRAYLGPSYLFGPEPQYEEPPAPSRGEELSPLKYPADEVESFHFNFKYSFETKEPLGSISTQCNISATGTDSTGKRSQLDLSPAAAQSGPEINWEFILPVNEAVAGGDILVTITVYPTVQTEAGPIFEYYIEQFEISREAGMLVIDRELGSTEAGNLGPFHYTQKGEIDYTIKMKEDSRLGGVMITPPPLTPEPPEVEPVSGKVLGPGDTIFTRLMEKLEADFRYRLVADTSVTEQQQTVSIDAVIQAGSVWSKSLNLVPEREIKNGDTITFEIDLPYFTSVMEDIRDELGVSADSYNLVIQANVRVSGNTPYGRINETFRPSISTPLTGGILKWTGEMNQSQGGTFSEKTLVPNDRSLMGMSVGTFSAVCLTLLVIFLLLFGFLGFVYYRNRAPMVPVVEKQARAIKKKYGERITESAGDRLPGGEQVIRMNTMEDLVKVADELGKPVVHLTLGGEEGQAHVYQIFDGEVVYRYEVSDIHLL